jgi:hypothetical protein
MSADDSSLEPDALSRARRLLSPVKPRERVWPVLAAAGFFAFSALAFATAMILAPPLVTQDVVQAAP